MANVNSYTCPGRTSALRESPFGLGHVLWPTISRNRLRGPLACVNFGWTDSWGVARIDDEDVVTNVNYEVTTTFPAEEILRAGESNYTTEGALKVLRGRESHENSGTHLAKARA